MTFDPQGTTASLVERARHGDADALQILLRRYLPRLQQWASGRLPFFARDLLDTDDLVQESVINTLRRLDSFEPEAPGSFLGYLRRAILNRIGDEIRRAKRKEEKADRFREDIPESASPLEQAIGSDTIARYERALAALEPDAQEAVIARIELGFSYAEIAESIGKPSADAARMIVNRAIRKLADSMRVVRDEA
jgi:RNA polymerase sigma-70 factor (ECF subfamily)